MDEIIFRISRSFDALQVQASLTTERSKILLQEGTEIAYRNIQTALNSTNAQYVKEQAQDLWNQILEILRQCHLSVNDVLQSPIDSLTTIIRIARQKSGGLDRSSVACGVLIGFCVGLILGLRLHNPTLIAKHMKAVVCSGYSGIDRIGFVDDVLTPSLQRSDEVLVQVKSACIDKVDFRIADGHGQFIRRCLSKYYDNKKEIFPLILGRACSGVVVEIGCRVTKVEIGDEVWVSSPVWCGGTICEMIVTRDCFVGKKPTKVSFEGAASLSYSGCLALKYLEDRGLKADNMAGKTVFIENCCSPIGCVITQILKMWGAVLTTTSSARAAPVAGVMGSNDNIVNMPKDLNANKELLTSDKLLLKELEVKNKSFDIIFITDNETIDLKQLRKFLNRSGQIISTIPVRYYSDNCNFIFGFIIFISIRIQYFLGRLFPSKQLEEQMFDKLFELVESEKLQSVVDHIYPPQNVEQAIAHKLSADAIGNTIFKFT